MHPGGAAQRRIGQGLLGGRQNAAVGRYKKNPTAFSEIDSVEDPVAQQCGVYIDKYITDMFFCRRQAVNLSSKKQTVGIYIAKTIVGRSRVDGAMKGYGRRAREVVAQVVYDLPFRGNDLNIAQILRVAAVFADELPEPGR